ncbi:MAG: hypothetical protein WD377_07940 [Nitriliruptoraceae bacterium]
MLSAALHARGHVAVIRVSCLRRRQFEHQCAADVLRLGDDHSAVLLGDASAGRLPDSRTGDLAAIGGAGEQFEDPLAIVGVDAATARIAASTSATMSGRFRLPASRERMRITCRRKVVAAGQATA